MVRYEDSIGGATAARKPGYSSPSRPQSAAEMRRRSFSQQLIAALEAAASMPSRTPTAAELARAAYDKLQFDFPLLTVTELDALVEALRVRLVAQQWPSLPLTVQLLDNALEGSVPPPPQAAGINTPAAEPLVNGAAAAQGNAPSATSATAAGSAPSSEPQQLQSLFQQLTATLVVKLLRRLLEAPPQEAFTQLSSFQADGVSDLGGAQAPQTMPEVAMQQHAPRLKAKMAQPSSHASSKAVSAVPDVPAHPASSGSLANEEIFAPEEDADGHTYEPLQPLPRQRSQRDQIGAWAGRQAFSWERLQGKLAALAAHAQYSQLGDEASWRRGRLADDAIAIVAAARQHEHAHALQGLSSVYVDLLAERMLDAPSTVACFSALCQALGACDVAPPAARGTAPAMPPGLLAAANVALRLFTGLSGPSSPAAATAQQPVASTAAAAAARRSLAKAVVAGLMSPLGAWLGVVAGVKAALPEAVQADIVVACRLVSSTVLSNAAAGGCNKALANTGTFRALTVLFAARGLASMDELRHALLLAAASDADLAAYASAVPGFTTVLNSEAFQVGGDAAAHGAVWSQLLPAASCVNGLPAVEQLLQLNSTVPEEQQVATLHATLQLLAQCWTAGGGRRPWAAAAEARLKSLPAALNALSNQATSAAVADAAGSEAHAIAAPAASPQPPRLSKVADEMEKKADRGGASLPNSAATEAARLRQLCRECIALLKEMAAGGQPSKRD